MFIITESFNTPDFSFINSIRIYRRSVHTTWLVHRVLNRLIFFDIERKSHFHHKMYFLNRVKLKLENVLVEGLTELPFALKTDILNSKWFCPLEGSYIKLKSNYALSNIRDNKWFKKSLLLTFSKQNSQTNRISANQLHIEQNR